MTGNAIREALEPFAKAADGYAPSVPDSDFARVKWFSVGDLRRARTAYDAIGSVVKADSGWVEWTGGETPVEPGTEGLIRVEDGEVIYTKQLGSFNFAHDRSGPFPGRRIVAYRVLSPHTAAGAGPVGEAVADEGWQPIETAPTGGKFGCFLMLAFGPQGDQTVSEGMHFQGRFYAASVFYTGGPHDTKQFTFREHEVKPTHWRHTLVAPGAARPVEPGEVERLTSERDGLEAMGLQAAADYASHVSDLEAALAGMRERLEKVEGLVFLADQALMELHGRFPLDEVTNEDRRLKQACKALRAITGPNHEARNIRADQVRAALTGDAQEAGR